MRYGRNNTTKERSFALSSMHGNNDKAQKKFSNKWKVILYMMILTQSTINQAEYENTRFLDYVINNQSIRANWIQYFSSKMIRPNEKYFRPWIYIIVSMK